MINLPEVNAAIVAVSRDCFPIELSRDRKERVVSECTNRGIDVINCVTVVENESDTLKALDELKQRGANALVIYLGNFGPEGPLSMLAQRFEGPVMVVGAAEESGDSLYGARGDAYCGMLNASYNLGLRHRRIHIPEYPVGVPADVAVMIGDFIPAARVVIGVKSLKIFGFGPRPQDFLACNAPIKPLYDLGVEVMENSELDLYDIYRAAEGHPAVKDIAADMATELGEGNAYPELLTKLAQFEHALMTFYEQNRGAAEYAVFADKCWPAFETYFGFVPCYVNSRLAGRGIPVACEVDIYGALSEYMVTAASGAPATLLDINNTVPRDMFDRASNTVSGYKPSDLFMGFHCGNTASTCMSSFAMKYQLIMNRLMESGNEPEITRGTLEGRIRPGEVSIFRIQSRADTCLESYVAEGEVLDIDPCSFGSIGVFAIREMGRFYRHVLIGRRFPHHTAVGFSQCGRALFDALSMLGVDTVHHNRPAELYYTTENPFS